MAFVLIDVTPAIIAEARRIRVQRDKIYGNIFQEEYGDMRWVGEIGEICFNSWAQANTILSVRWIQGEKAAGKPDFMIGSVPIGVKTVKRKVPMRPYYTAQITARHAHEPVEHFFFASYEYPKQRLWLLGGITKEDFLQHARYYGPGEQVHADYIVRPGHEIYNIEISWLTSPEEWLKSFQ